MQREKHQQLQCVDGPAQRAGSPSLASAISPENPIYQGALAGSADTAGDVSARNDSATQRADTGNIRGICSPGVPADFEVGKTYRMRCGGKARIDRVSGDHHLVGWNYPANGEYSWWRTGEGGHQGVAGPYDLVSGEIREFRFVDPRLRKEDQPEIDNRLLSALQDAGHSALGMPSSVDTIKAMLARAGLALVLA